MTRNTTNAEPKVPRVPVAKLQDAARLLDFAYQIRASLPVDAERWVARALDHAPGILEKISAFDIPCGRDPTAVVAWARKIIRAPVDNA